jgi:type IV secretion system protein VirB9|tara:strand:+ start:31240 stop:32253 length:1014 start_codon:yes stop_codon:yes gene_type:complete
MTIANASHLKKSAPLLAALAVNLALTGCATNRTYIPPEIDYDDMAPAVLTVDPPAPVQVVELPTPLPLPGQLRPLDGEREPDDRDPADRVLDANEEARMEPTQDGYINAVQVYPYSAGALYQVYAAPGQVTDIALQPGESLVGAGPVALGDTVRWIVGDTESGAGDARQIHILVKPTRPDLLTNLIINTDRRTYLVELNSTETAYMAQVSWQYPQDQLIALRQQNTQAQAQTPIAEGVDIASLNFRYAIEGDSAPWRPLRAFDDSQRVYIEFPSGIAQGDLPPLFTIGPAGGTDLVNYRVRNNYMIVDRLFAAAELRLGDGNSQRIVRIVRTDGRRP